MRVYMLNNFITCSLIIASAIICGALLERTNQRFHYEIHGDDIGFTVKVDKTNGERCLMNEGAVRAVVNWQDMVKRYPVPLNLCDGDKGNRIVFLDEAPRIMNSQNPNNKAEGPFGIYDDLVPKNKKNP
jgi:hypothetical protein